MARTRPRKSRPQPVKEAARANAVSTADAPHASRSIMSIVIAILSTIYMLALTVPWLPVRARTIGYFDYSWMLVLHDAIATSRQFGTQLIVPYGPLGFIATNIYDPRTYLLLLAIRLALSLIVLRVLWEAAKVFIPHPLAALPWMAAIIAMMAPGITAHDSAYNAFDMRMLGGAEDHFFSICAILALSGYFSVHRRTVSKSMLAMIVLLAIASLAKVNFLMQDVVVVGAISIDQFLLQRKRKLHLSTDSSDAGSEVLRSAGSDAGRNPALGSTSEPASGKSVDRSATPGPWWLIPALYLGCLVALYFAARQSPSSIGPFLWSWLQVTGGHMDATGLAAIPVDVIAFIIVAVLVLIMIGAAQWTDYRRGAILPTLAMALLFGLLYKHSFVRQDFAHATIGPMAAFAAALLFLPLGWRAACRRWQRGFCIFVVTLAGVVVWSSLLTVTREPEQEGLPRYAWETLPRTSDAFRAIVANVSFPHTLHDRWESQRERVRNENILPIVKISGPTDVYPHRQDVVMAYSLQYDPRPAFSSLFATAPSLAELNRRHLLGAAVPETILFDIEPIDMQFPSLADGWSWPQLLTRYDVIDSSGAMLVLRRAKTPRAYHLASLATLSGRWDQAVDIPDANAAPLWARIHLHRRLAGRIFSMAYKPPMVQIEVQTRDGTVGQYRLLPSLAEQGFLLSPVIKDRAAFAGLASKGWAVELAPFRVDKIMLSVVDGSGELNYEPEFTIDLDRLEIER